MTNVTVAAMVAHDARASAAIMGGTVHNTREDFTAAIAEAEAWRERARRPVPPEVARQLRDGVQRLHDAIWYGTRAQVQACAAEVGPVLQEWEPQHRARVETINPGDFIRVAGVNLYDRSADAATGVVVDAIYMVWDAFPGRGYVGGFAVTVRPVVPFGRTTEEVDLFVLEGDTVLRLPRPRQRRRCPAWLAEGSAG